MPIIVLDTQCTINRQAVITSRLIDYGMLYSLSAVIVFGNSRTGRTHITAGIFNTTPDDAHTICVLIDDYVYQGHSPSWSGKLPIEAGCGLFALTRSSDAPVVRLSGHILKYDP
jgi:hypothetical protein